MGSDFDSISIPVPSNYTSLFAGVSPSNYMPNHHTVWLRKVNGLIYNWELRTCISARFLTPLILSHDCCCVVYGASKTLILHYHNNTLTVRTQTNQIQYWMMTESSTLHAYFLSNKNFLVTLKKLQFISRQKPHFDSPSCNYSIQAVYLWRHTGVHPVFLS